MCDRIPAVRISLSSTTAMSNHLVSSNSLYLRKHAHNPIDWWPWCE
ncbi:MAG: DUF255 domain-containing protein, partial [Merismopedia sp. SIO2A8]|nr:DUF255 domain-containing protein [Merismopedia sp. SIO2A8]